MSSFEETRTGDTMSTGNKAWLVADVDELKDGVDNLVHCCIVFGSFETAMTAARSRAEEILSEYNVYARSGKNPMMQPMTFDEAWATIDHNDGLEHIRGFTPNNNSVSPFSIVVVQTVIAEA